MPTTKAELERLVEELQQKLEKAQQSKESIEAAVQAAMTSQFEEELARAVPTERKRTNVVTKVIFKSRFRFRRRSVHILHTWYL